MAWLSCIDAAAVAVRRARGEVPPRRIAAAAQGPALARSGAVA